MDEELHLSLLGGMQITRDGEPVTGFVSGKVQALLCYLAVTGRPHLRPALAGLLWAELPEADAKANLRQILANLRRLLAPYLSITCQAIGFNHDSPYWLDVECFETNVEDASGETPSLGCRKQSGCTGVTFWRASTCAGRRPSRNGPWPSGQDCRSWPCKPCTGWQSTAQGRERLVWRPA
jgi:hypothetical protein